MAWGQPIGVLCRLLQGMLSPPSNACARIEAMIKEPSAASRDCATIRQTNSFIENSIEAGILLGGNGCCATIMPADPTTRGAQVRVFQAHNLPAAHLWTSPYARLRLLAPSAPHGHGPGRSVRREPLRGSAPSCPPPEGDGGWIAVGAAARTAAQSRTRRSRPQPGKVLGELWADKLAPWFFLGLLRSLHSSIPPSLTHTHPPPSFPSPHIHSFAPTHPISPNGSLLSLSFSR
jgi:hypothetical protein